MTNREHPRHLARIIACVILALAVASVAEAGAVRGRLMRRTPRGDVPAQGVPVTVMSPNPQVGRSGASYSGADGMYYLYNIPPGTYTLEVWPYPNRPPLTYTITVGTQAFTDVAPIVIP